MYIHISYESAACRVRTRKSFGADGVVCVAMTTTLKNKTFEEFIEALGGGRRMGRALTLLSSTKMAPTWEKRCYKSSVAAEKCHVHAHLFRLLMVCLYG